MDSKILKLLDLKKEESISSSETSDGEYSDIASNSESDTSADSNNSDNIKMIKMIYFFNNKITRSHLLKQMLANNAKALFGAHMGAIACTHARHSFALRMNASRLELLRNLVERYARIILQ